MPIQWEVARASYPSPDLLEVVNLKDKVMLVTGANSGIGYCLVEFLASKGARTYMVCRDQVQKIAQFPI